MSEQLVAASGAASARIAAPDRADRAQLGGKGRALAELGDGPWRIPPWIAVVPSPGGDAGQPIDERQLDAALDAIAEGHATFAVRSSARDEDGAGHSFAGQYETHLFVPRSEVVARIRDVWRAANAARVAAYRRERGLAGDGLLPTVLVQRMLDPEAAGVAFSADPVSGRRAVCVVGATRGVGERLVSGEVDGDSWRVASDGTIVERSAAAEPSLADAQVREVAALARQVERRRGVPQDIEWAWADGALWLLQARPITSLATLPDPDAAPTLWDNSNIAESYGGVTTPLTFSFARMVYEEVYRQFCRIVRVPEHRIDGADDALRAMLGLVRGRVYYNLVSWYRVLALLPGYTLNRRFMEQMMGVKEGIPEALEARVRPPTGGGRLAEWGNVLRTVTGLIGAHRRLDADVAAFHRRLDEALATGGDLARLRADELVAHYRELERRLLTRWDAPLVNDFFAMIHYGALRALATTWCGDEDGTLQNALVGGDGGIISAEPARRIVELSRRVAAHPALAAALADGSAAEAHRALAAHPELRQAVDDYLVTFGDRCLDELKLETATLDDDPLPLLRAIGRGAAVRAVAAPTTAARPSQREGAERRAMAALSGRPLRRVLFRWVLGHARRRVRDRENLRFERTRVFGRVRRIFVELGRRYAAIGLIDDPRDVFWLTVDEALGAADATTATMDLRAVAAARRAEFERYAGMDAPPDRFLTRGPVHPDTRLEPAGAAVEEAPASGDRRKGLGCYPGRVRGVVRVVRDPRGAELRPGEILVAERTDPGWVLLFPAASALLVERGSLLSHAAIVARELGLPAVVSVPGVTSWLRTGDVVELDGETGLVVRMDGAAEAA